MKTIFFKEKNSNQSIERRVLHELGIFLFPWLALPGAGGPNALGDLQCQVWSQECWTRTAPRVAHPQSIL